MKETQATSPTKILAHIERVANAFKGSKLNDNNKSKILESQQKDLHKIADFLSCEEEEAWLFSIMFAMSISGKDADLDQLTHYLSCNPFFVVSLLPTLDSLVSKRLLLKNAGYDSKMISTSFHISSEAFSAVSNNIARKSSQHFEDIYALIERFNDMICERERNNIHTNDFINEFISLIKSQKHFKLIKKVLKLGLSEEETVLLLHLCYVFANENNEADIERYIYYVYDSMGAKIRAKKYILSGNSELFRQELISFVDNSFYGGRELALTDKGIELLFEEDLSLLDKQKSFTPKNCQVFEPDKIQPVKLFFNQEEDKQIAQIRQIIAPENLAKVSQKLKALHYPSGMSILLYGAPGTGKTQIAYNLAAQTNRHLLMVDIASIRDKYVGESEKRIKQIFKTYQQACEHYDNMPILFFNEADALISRRYEVNSSVDQMNNSMQNILLQALEDFEGILIATSNLSQNLDPAFERRFLYKLQFHKPEENTRKAIWQDKMPKLSEKFVEILAHDYDLSGGQIHNIARKYILNELLNDSEELDLVSLKELCELEFLRQQSHKPLGFKSLGE